MIRLILLVFLAGTAGFSGGTASAQTGTNRPGLPDSATEANLPVVFLVAKETIPSDQKTPCTVRIAGAIGREDGATNRWPALEVIHGGVSRGYPKKSIGFTLEAPAPLLDMAPHRHWILNAAYINRSLMRHKLSYDLFRSLSVPGSPRFAAASRFVEVVVNSNYHGVYLLMERVDRQRLGLQAYSSNDLNHACLYKAVDHAADFRRRGHAGYEQKEPEPTIRPYWQPLDEFNRFVSSAPAPEFFHPEASLASRLDLNNAIDFHLLVLLTSNGDGITKNFLLARDGQASGPTKPRFFFVPWDYDGTFGRNWDGSVSSPSDWLSNHLFDRLLGNAAYRDKFVARWNQLRDRQFSAKTIQSMMDTNVRLLGDAPRRNAARWPVAGWPYPDRVTFEGDVSRMKSWIEARVSWLDREINQRLAHSP